MLNALPFHRAIAVAGLCAKAGVHYFDLTEDVASTHAIQALAADARSVLMPQCGLAPIGIVGNALAASIRCWTCACAWARCRIRPTACATT